MTIEQLFRMAFLIKEHKADPRLLKMTPKIMDAMQTADIIAADRQRWAEEARKNPKPLGPIGKAYLDDNDEK